MNNNCHCPVLDEIEATKEAVKTVGAGYPPNQNEEISSKQIGQSTANARIKKTTLLIILEGSSNCRLSCPILDEKEATKEEEPSKTLLRVKYQFPTKFFYQRQARVKSEHEAKEDDVANHREAQEAEVAREIREAKEA